MPAISSLRAPSLPAIAPKERRPGAEPELIEGASKGQSLSYGKLCSLFYDANNAYASVGEVSFYASLIEQNPGRVLEAMSGSGRLQIPLLTLGYVVDGVDNSAAMIAQCIQRCVGLQLAPDLYEQSLETLSLPHKYSTVTIALGSFQLITDRAVALQILKNLHAHMQLQANLLIDIFVPDTCDAGDVAQSQTVRTVTIDARTIIRLTTRYVFDVSAKIADAFNVYELIIDGTVVEQEDELIRVTWYTDEELVSMLNAAGFELIKIHENAFGVGSTARVVQARAMAK